MRMGRKPILCPHGILGKSNCILCRREKSRRANKKYRATKKGKLKNKECRRNFLRTSKGKKYKREARRRHHLKKQKTDPNYRELNRLRSEVYHHPERFKVGDIIS